MNAQIDDLNAIRNTVDKYGEGITTGDIALLRSAFHSKAMMYGCDGDNVTVVEIEGLYDYVSAQEPPIKSGEPHRCFITSIDVAGNAASVKVAQEHCYGVHYTNYFQLLKIRGRWIIMSKSYNAVPAGDVKADKITGEENHSVA